MLKLLIGFSLCNNYLDVKSMFYSQILGTIKRHKFFVFDGFLFLKLLFKDELALLNIFHSVLVDVKLI